MHIFGNNYKIALVNKYRCFILLNNIGGLCSGKMKNESNEKYNYLLIKRNMTCMIITCYFVLTKVVIGSGLVLRCLFTLILCL